MYNCPYLPYGFQGTPPKCPHLNILQDFVREFRLDEEHICAAGIPDLTRLPQMPLELEHPLNPASYPLYCGICKLLHSHRIGRPLQTPYEEV